MKTLLSSGIAGCLILGLVACAGGDSHDGTPLVTPEAFPAPAAPPSEAPPAATPANTPDESADGLPAAVPSDPAQRTPEAMTPVALAGTPGTPSARATAALDWRPCGQFEDRDIECAELDVPIDYAQPDGDEVTLALRRILASPLDPHHGSLLFNPGGPGGYGIDSALQLFEGGVFEQIAPGFDIIGFDPRGVAESGERGCGISEPDLYPGAQTATTREAGLQDYLDYYRTLGGACEKTWGSLLGKLGSNNVVKDMEEIRKALNEPVLNFYGTSYGTRLGALYAHDYPKTAGRIVLDAPVSPRGSYVEETRDQYYQVLSLNEQIFTACEAGTITCTPNVRQVFAAAVANATQRGIEQAFSQKWAGLLANPQGLLTLLQALASEAANPGGDWILSFMAPGGDGGFSSVVFAAVNCSDDPVAPPTTAQLQSLLAEFEQASPVFGNYALYASVCASWPVTSDPVPLPTAIDAPAVLVIGGTADSRTPYPWAQQMTETLGNATLLTSIHWGHGAVLNGSDCVRQAVRAYLTSGSMPASGAQCQ